ncbi:CorA family divalent cation transporter [Lysobacter yananisis]|uniref:CorA family divalent cation transporter n=1 Tax=Lysobacter yananisis TaxID=1003114 RepID=A0ABY9PAT6_9GAMM|nr:CorA family divalent cation transporter [Lysobacter yananisis]WMT04146.1 CorA family divalent cation transporter [Lysobacter yananisis]
MDEKMKSRQQRNKEVTITHYRKGGDGADLALDQISDDVPDEELLWVDISSSDESLVRETAKRLGLSEVLADRLASRRDGPWIDSDGSQFAVLVMAAVHEGNLAFHGAPFALAAGKNVILSVHADPLNFVDELRSREGRRSRVGALTAESFVASLLGWHLDSYFQAASDYERYVERLEESVLRSHEGERLNELRQLRKGASRLRRMLAPHRYIFSSLARPDFRPDTCSEAKKQFTLLADHYERAMDVIENARDLMIGSFELFSNQVALQTNETMRVLTFITIVIGLQTVVAGVLGMNFDAPFFKTHALGFWIALVGMGVLCIGSLLVGRWRRWY